MTIASLFSGIGGELVAAQMLGWDVAFHCDINKFCSAVLDYWFPKADSYGDIKKTDFSKWRGKVDVLTGGFPCQPFGTTGERRGAEDDRYLWPEMLRCINQVRPAWIVGENVAGILSMVEQPEVTRMANTTSLFAEDNDVRGQYKQSETFTIERICSDLEGAGYSVQPMLIPACAVGAPHRRDRIFIIANRLSTDSSDAGLQHGNKSGGKERKAETLQGERWPDSFWNIYATANGYRGNTSCTKEYAGEPCCRWYEQFPSKSPIHRGNDGIPFDVSNLSIPFPRWRKGSLMALGNAIVPGIMYEILQAIGKIE